MSTIQEIRDKASLIMKPAAYKAGKLYSYVPVIGTDDANYPQSYGDFNIDRNSTATRVNSQFMVEEVATDVPRLDYQGGGCPVYLIEPSRTNVVTYSEDFSQWTVGVGAPTVTSNATTAPDGTTTADKLTATVTTTSQVYMGITTTQDETYVYSIFAKKAESNYLVMQPNNGTNRITVFDLTTGLNTRNDGGFDVASESYPDGWWRFTITVLYTPSADARFRINVASNSSGSVAVVGEGMYVWGAQLELGNYVTSYIKTGSSTSNRAGDSSTLPDMGPNGILTSAGCIYLEFSDAEVSSSTTANINFYGTSISDNYVGLYATTTSHNLRTYADGGGVTNNISLGDISGKLAISWPDSSEITVFKNGIEITGFSAPNFDSSLFDNTLIRASADAKYCIKEVNVYPTSLTDEELAILTT